MSGSEDGTGRVPERLLESTDGSKVHKCVRECTCACVCWCVRYVCV